MSGDVSEILQVVAAYGLHADGRRWEPLTELFTTDVRVDYTALRGGEPQTLAASELVGGWKGFLPGFTGTSHLIGLPLIAVTGGKAAVEAPFTASHRIDDPAVGKDDIWSVGGRYRFQLVKIDSRWRISAVQILPAWQSGNRYLGAHAERRARLA